MAEANLVDKILLKNFVPVSALNGENFQKLAVKTTVEEVPAGRVIFKQWEVEVTPADGKSIIVKSGTDAAKHTLANHQPRKHTAVTKGPSKITRIDSDLLNILLTWDQLSPPALKSTRLLSKGKWSRMTRI